MTAPRSPRLRAVGWLSAFVASCAVWVGIIAALALVLSLAACGAPHPGGTQLNNLTAAPTAQLPNLPTAQQVAQGLNCTDVRPAPDFADSNSPGLVSVHSCTLGSQRVNLYQYRTPWQAAVAGHAAPRDVHPVVAAQFVIVSTDAATAGTIQQEVGR